MARLLSGVDTVIFDLDGTLIDSVGPFMAIVNRTLAEVGLPLADRREVCAALQRGGSPFPHLVPAAHPRRETLVEACDGVAYQLWPNLVGTDVPFLPGAIDTLRELAHRGYATGIATSSWGEHVGRFRDEWRAAGLPCEVVAGDEVANQKPAPDVVVECLRRLSRSAGSAIYVGDSPLDIAAARAAGCRAIGVLSGVSDRPELAALRPAAIVDSVVDLLGLLG